MKTVYLFFSIFVFISCGTKNTTGSQNPVLDGTYALTQVGDEELTSQEFTFKFDAEENTVFGFTGCNGFSADFTQEEQAISFTAPVSTRKFCKDKMETEQTIHRALEEISGFQKKGTHYVFYSKENNPLITLIKTDERE